MHACTIYLEIYTTHTCKHTVEWIIPVTTGAPPPPCAAFSLTRVDPYRLVVFGGRRLRQRVNEVHILDLDTWVSRFIIKEVQGRI